MVLYEPLLFILKNLFLKKLKAILCLSKVVFNTAVGLILIIIRLMSNTLTLLTTSLPQNPYLAITKFIPTIMIEVTLS